MASYDIRKEHDGYHIYNQVTGEDRGKTKTRAGAETQMNRLKALEPAAPGKVSPGVLDGKEIGGVPTYLDDTYTRRQVERAYIDGRPVAVERPSTTIDVAPVSASETPATAAPAAAAVPAFKFGGVLGKVKKAATKVKNAPGDARDAVGRQLDRADDTIFGNEGLGSNIRKLREERRKNK